jgi:predicted deacylase
VHRFGTRGAAPKLYFQAALHADELPGTLVLNHLIGWLKAADQKGEVSGEVVVCPYANPVGLASRIHGYHLGRYDLDGDGNFNRWYPNLADKIAAKVGNRLSGDADENRRLIRAAALEAVAAWKAEGEANVLRKALMALSMDCDLIFDLHCHGDALQYAYFPEPYWETYGDLMAETACEVILFYPTDEGTNFDVAPTIVWHEMAKRFPERAIPPPPFTTTLELRGQQDCNDRIAEKDARGLWRFLQRHGIVAGDPGPAPTPLGRPTPLEGADYLVAPKAGVLSYRVDMGAKVRAGEVVADIVDPAEVDFARARTPVATRTDGIFYGRNLSLLVRPGQSFAVVAGDRPLPPPELPVIDY